VIRWGTALLVLVLAPVAACGGEDTAARDKCEAAAGVGNCVEREGEWVPLGSKGGTTSTTARPTTTRTPRTSEPAPDIRGFSDFTDPGRILCLARYKVDDCVYDHNIDRWVPAPGARPTP
jgi:hypothetical protein